MLSGKTPFNGKDDVTTRKNIIYKEIEFPNNFSQEAIDIIKELLKKNP